MDEPQESFDYTILIMMIVAVVSVWEAVKRVVVWMWERGARRPQEPAAEQPDDLSSSSDEGGAEDVGASSPRLRWTRDFAFALQPLPPRRQQSPHRRLVCSGEDKMLRGSLSRLPGMSSLGTGIAWWRNYRPTSNIHGLSRFWWF